MQWGDDEMRADAVSFGIPAFFDNEFATLSRASHFAKTDVHSAGEASAARFPSFRARPTMYFDILTCSRQSSICTQSFNPGAKSFVKALRSITYSHKVEDQNDQDQPVGAIDLPCEKPPTPTWLHLIVRQDLGVTA